MFLFYCVFDFEELIILIIYTFSRGIDIIYGGIFP